MSAFAFLKSQLDSDVPEHWLSVAANNLDIRIFVYLSFSVVCSTGKWLLDVPLMVPLDDMQIGSWGLKVKWCRSIYVFPWFHTVTYLLVRINTVISCSVHWLQVSPAAACHGPNTATCVSLMPVFVGSVQGVMLVVGSGEFRTLEEHLKNMVLQLHLL